MSCGIGVWILLGSLCSGFRLRVFAGGGGGFVAGFFAIGRRSNCRGRGHRDRFQRLRLPCPLLPELATAARPRRICGRCPVPGVQGLPWCGFHPTCVISCGCLCCRSLVASCCVRFHGTLACSAASCCITITHWTFTVQHDSPYLFPGVLGCLHSGDEEVRVLACVGHKIRF